MIQSKEGKFARIRICMCRIVIKDNILQTEVAKKDLDLFFGLKRESAHINFTLCRNILASCISS